MAMKPLEIFVNNERTQKTRDISKLIPLELLDSVENTVLDPDIQKNGYTHRLPNPVKDPFKREIDTISLPPVRSIIEQDCWILDIIHIMFNTILKVEEGYLNEEFEYSRVSSAVNSYINRALSDSVWGKKGLFRNICVSYRCSDTFRAVALPNSYHGIDWIGVPKEAMRASERKHGDFCLITRFPAVWDGSIEVMRARASGNDTIEIHPLLHEQFNLDHDGDALTGFWIPKDKDCTEEANENVLQFFINESSGKWPKELNMNDRTTDKYITSDLEKLNIEVKKRLVPDGLSINPEEILAENHDLDTLLDKKYKEDTAIIAKGISKKEFYDRSININKITLTTKMFMGPVGQTANDIKLVGKNGSDKVRRSAMYISEAIQQALMNSKHEIGDPNTMKFMVMKDAINGSGETRKDIDKISECLVENGLDIEFAFPFIAHMYLIIPIKHTINELSDKAHVDTVSKRKVSNLVEHYMNFTDFDITNYTDIAKSIRKIAVKDLNCSVSEFTDLFNKYKLNLRSYVQKHFPIYSLATKVNTVRNKKKQNELSSRVLISHEIDPYGSCSDEYKILGD